MGIEIDMIPVGAKSKGGDAFALRWGNLVGERSEQFVAVIDGGNQESGQKLVEHIKKYYGTDLVDLVVCSHPHSDHSSGLREVLNNLRVSALLMHSPWEHYDEFQDYFNDSGEEYFVRTTKKDLSICKELYDIAEKKGTKIIEPYPGQLTGTPIHILAPSRDLYGRKLSQFDGTPVSAEASNVSFSQKVKTFINFVSDFWHRDSLRNPLPEETSAENEASVVLLIDYEGEKLLFTGDSGVEGLSEAYDYSVNNGIDLKTVKFIKIPHHGSKHNLGPDILDKIIGPKTCTDISNSNKTAYINCPPENEEYKHPSKRVINDLLKRGVNSYCSSDGQKWHHIGTCPERNWGVATPMSFSNQVEED